MSKTIYASKPTKYGVAQIVDGGYHKYALIVGGKIIAQSNDWDYIKTQYDKY